MLKKTCERILLFVLVVITLIGIKTLVEYETAVYKFKKSEPVVIEVYDTTTNSFAYEVYPDYSYQETTTAINGENDTTNFTYYFQNNIQGYTESYSTTGYAYTTDNSYNNTQNSSDSYEYTTSPNNSAPQISQSSTNENTAFYSTTSPNIVTTFPQTTTRAQSAPGMLNAEYFVTATGTKYHLNGCHYLSKSRIPVTVQEIYEKGYQPCSYCIPE